MKPETSDEESAVPNAVANIDANQLWGSLQDWLTTHYMEIAIAVAAAVGIYLVLNAVRAFGLKLRDRGDPDKASIVSVIGQALWQTKQWFMLITAIKLVAAYAAMPPALSQTITFLFTIAVVFQVAIWAREIVLGMIYYRAKASGDSEDTLGSAMTLIRLLVTAVIFAIALIVVLDNLGVDVTGLVAGLGVGGIAIGLAAQGIFEELFAALSIIFDKPFKKGDAVAYDNTSAAVEKIGLKTTRLRAFTGEEKIISNSNLLDKEITNLTRLSKRRIKFGVGLIYQTKPDDAERVPDVLKEIVEGCGHTFIRAGFVGFGDSSINYEVEFDVESPSWDVVYKGRHDIGLGIYRRFAQEGFEFAYPTQMTFTAGPAGEAIMPYPDVKLVATES